MRRALDSGRLDAGTFGQRKRSRRRFPGDRRRFSACVPGGRRRRRGEGRLRVAEMAGCGSEVCLAKDSKEAKWAWP